MCDGSIRAWMIRFRGSTSRRMPNSIALRSNIDGREETPAFSTFRRIRAMTNHHPDANLFPMLSEAELSELAADIVANGQRETIKLDHTGEFLVDGRNRERACYLAGIDPRYERIPA